jgi:hypothetical protein
MLSFFFFIFCNCSLELLWFLWVGLEQFPKYTSQEPWLKIPDVLFSKRKIPVSLLPEIQWQSIYVCAGLASWHVTCKVLRVLFIELPGMLSHFDHFEQGTLHFLFFIHLFTCAYTVWVIFPSCPPLPPFLCLPPSVPGRSCSALITNFVEEKRQA